MFWKKKGEKKEEHKEEKKDVSLLEEVCRDDTELRDCLSSYLFLNPIGAISKKDIDTLMEEGEKSGDFRPAVDKAIFEGSQSPAEREKYIKVIQNLARKTIDMTEKEIRKVENEGLNDRAASLRKVIKNQEFMNARAGDILNTASKFYNETLIEQEEKAGKEERAVKRTTAQAEEWRAEQDEKKRREAAKKELREMGRQERADAEKQETKEEVAAQERQEARKRERIEAEKEEGVIDEREKEEREARKKERIGS